MRMAGVILALGGALVLGDLGLVKANWEAVLIAVIAAGFVFLAVEILDVLEDQP